MLPDAPAAVTVPPAGDHLALMNGSPVPEAFFVFFANEPSTRPRSLASA